MDDKLIQELKEVYNDNISDVELLITYIDDIPDSIENRSEVLERAQSVLNKLYDLNPSDVLIEVQVLINKYRYEFDITDPREVIHIDNGKGFVQ